MPIFDTSLPLTIPQQISRQILFLSAATFDSIVLSYKARYDDFWRNPKATPIEIAEAMDTQALSFFQNAEAMRVSIESISSNSLPEHSGVPEGWSATPEMNGGIPTGRMIIAQV